MDAMLQFGSFLSGQTQSAFTCLLCFSLLHPRQTPMGRMGAGYSWSPPTFVAMAQNWAAGSSVCQQSQPSMQVRSPKIQVKTSGIRPAPKERVLKLETALAAMEGMEGPDKRAQEAVQGAPLDTQIIPLKGNLSFGGVGCQTGHLSQHRDVQDTAGRIEGHDSCTSRAGRRGRSAAIKRVGVSIASADRHVAAESKSRFCSPVQRGDGGVDGGAPRRSPDGHGIGTASRGGQSVSIDDKCGTRVAPVSRADDHSFTGGEHSEVMRRLPSSGQFCELIRLRRRFRRTAQEAFGLALTHSPVRRDVRI